MSIQTPNARLSEQYVVNLRLCYFFAGFRNLLSERKFSFKKKSWTLENTTAPLITILKQAWVVDLEALAYTLLCAAWRTHNRFSPCSCLLCLCCCFSNRPLSGESCWKVMVYSCSPSGQKYYVHPGGAGGRWLFSHFFRRFIAFFRVFFKREKQPTIDCRFNI